jgi:hypothetical protein
MFVRSTAATGVVIREPLPPSSVAAAQIAGIGDDLIGRAFALLTTHMWRRLAGFSCFRRF